MARLLPILVLAAVFWAGLPKGSFTGAYRGDAAWAKGGSGDSGSGSSGGSGSNSGSGSSNSGSGSSSDDDDDDDDDDSTAGGGTATAGSIGKATLGEGFLRLLGGGGIHVQYADGHIERIRNGNFEATDPRGVPVERRRATREDQRRLERLERRVTTDGRAAGIMFVAAIDERAGAAEVTDFRGWREVLSRGRYLLSDPSGRTVTKRGLTAEDVARLRSILFPD